MFIQSYLQYNTTFASNNQLAKDSQSFTCGYNYWVEILFERASKLFNWKNTGEVPAKEIEIALLMNGSCAATKYKNKLVVMNGMFSGQPTIYYDEFEDYSVYSPVYSNVLKIGRDCIVGSNNTCKNSLYPLIHRYAIMLAHAEVSLIDALVNGRQGGAVPIASTENEKRAIEEYRNALFNGKVVPILDPAFSGVDFKIIDSSKTDDIRELFELRQNILTAFYGDLGVKTAKEKKGNMIDAEVNANDAMLMLNLSDMLAFRKKFCEEVNAMYGVNWSVDISDELKYNLEKGDDDNVGTEKLQSKGTAEES